MRAEQTGRCSRPGWSTGAVFGSLGSEKTRVDHQRPGLSENITPDFRVVLSEIMAIVLNRALTSFRLEPWDGPGKAARVKESFVLTPIEEAECGTPKKQVSVHATGDLEPF